MKGCFVTVKSEAENNNKDYNVPARPVTQGSHSRDASRRRSYSQRGLYHNPSRSLSNIPTHGRSNIETTGLFFTEHTESKKSSGNGKSLSDSDSTGSEDEKSFSDSDSIRSDTTQDVNGDHAVVEC